MKKRLLSAEVLAVVKRYLPLTKRILAILLSGFFALLALDWFAGLVAFCIGSPYRGAFFPEVWNITQLLFTWIPKGTITRIIMGGLVAFLTFAIPIAISCLSFRWFSKSLTKKT